LLKEYSKNPINNFEMDNFTIKYHEGNFICGDDINVFLLIKDNKVKSFSYTGNLSMVSLASNLQKKIIFQQINLVSEQPYPIKEKELLYCLC